MSKQYSTKILTKGDDAEIKSVLVANPLWKLKDARDLVARRKFQRSIDQVKTKPTLESFCKMLGCTVAQAETLRAKNKAQLTAMYDEAWKTGRRVNGYTAEQLRQLINGLEIPKARSPQQQPENVPPSTRLLDQCSTLVGNEIRFTYKSHKEAADALNKARAEHAALEVVVKSLEKLLENCDTANVDNKVLQAAYDSLANLDAAREGGSR